MFNCIPFLLSFVFIANQAFAANPQVSNIRTHQIENTFTVEILYDLLDPDPNHLTVSVEISKDGDETFLILPESLTGDIGENISPGLNKAIYWDAGKDLPGVFGTDYRAKVIVKEEISLGSEDVELNQYHWRLVSTTGPDPRSYPQMVYNSKQHEVILFGGLTRNDPEQWSLGDTWSWDGTRWTLRNLDGPHRFQGGISYSEITDKVYLFGGQRAEGNPPASVPLNDMWVWNGIQWEEIFLPFLNTPGFRVTPFMTSDQTRLVLFGGSDSNISSNTIFTLPDTWVYEFSDSSVGWRQIDNNGPITQTNIKSIGNMAYHEDLQIMVIYNSFDSKLHTFDGANWETITIPPALLPDGTVVRMSDYRLVYFPPTKSVLVHGGTLFYDGQRKSSNRLWELTDLNHITPLLVDGPEVYFHNIVYDSEREQLVLFGGRYSEPENTNAFVDLSETWVFGK